MKYLACMAVAALVWLCLPRRKSVPSVSEARAFPAACAPSAGSPERWLECLPGPAYAVMPASFGSN
jgi:hypothetical protein